MKGTVATLLATAAVASAQYNFGTNTAAGYGNFGANTALYGNQFAGQYGNQFSTAGTALYGNQFATTGANTALYGNQFSTAGTALYGNQFATTGANTALYGNQFVNSGVSTALYGNQGVSSGLYDNQWATNGVSSGLYGNQFANNGVSSGLYGNQWANNGVSTGLYGANSGLFNGMTSATGLNNGIYNTNGLYNGMTSANTWGGNTWGANTGLYGGVTMPATTTTTGTGLAGLSGAFSNINTGYNLNTVATGLGYTPDASYYNVPAGTIEPRGTIRTLPINTFFGTLGEYTLGANGGDAFVLNDNGQRVLDDVNSAYKPAIQRLQQDPFTNGLYTFLATAANSFVPAEQFTNQPAAGTR